MKAFNKEYCRPLSQGSDRLTWSVLFLILLLPNISRATDDSVGLGFRFSDINGKSYTLSAPAECQALVVIFVTTDCPIANSYQPALARMYQEFHKKGFEFALVHEGPDQSIDQLKEHSKEYAVPFSVVMDVDHSVARAVKATKTPEVFVFGKAGEVHYQGRIDNLHQALGKKRAKATRDDLQIALMELESGKPISVPKTEAVGCSIQLK